MKCRYASPCPAPELFTISNALQRVNFRSKRRSARAADNNRNRRHRFFPAAAPNKGRISSSFSKERRQLVCQNVRFGADSAPSRHSRSAVSLLPFKSVGRVEIAKALGQNVSTMRQNSALVHFAVRTAHHGQTHTAESQIFILHFPPYPCRTPAAALQAL